MDLTPEYIKLCERAVVIQENWVPGEGDYIFDKGGAWSFPLSGGEQASNMGCKAIGSDDQLWPPRFHRENALWLPRQDQIQEMIPNPIFYKLDSFYSFVYKRFGLYATVFTSFEQLWLVFLMADRYRLYWNGDDWADETPMLRP